MINKKCLPFLFKSRSRATLTRYAPVLILAASLVSHPLVFAAGEPSLSLSPLCARLLNPEIESIAAADPLDFQKLVDHIPQTAVSHANVNIVVISILLPQQASFGAVDLIKQSAREFELAVPADLSAITTEAGRPVVNFTIFGNPLQLALFLKKLQIQLEASTSIVVSGRLVIGENINRLSEIALDQTMLELSPSGFRQLLADLSASADQISARLVNNPSSGFFFVSIPQTQVDQYLVAAQSDARLPYVEKDEIALDVKNLSYRELNSALIKVQKGKARVVITGDGRRVMTLTAVSELAAFQRLRNRLTHNLVIPHVRLPETDIGLIVECAGCVASSPELSVPVRAGEFTLAEPLAREPSEPLTHKPFPKLASPGRTQELNLDGAGERKISFSDFYSKGVFRQFFVPGSPSELSLALPLITMTFWNVPRFVILSVDKLRSTILSDVQALIESSPGQYLSPATVGYLKNMQDAMISRKFGAVVRHPLGSMWAGKGSKILEESARSQRPVLVVGEMGISTVEDDSPLNFIIVPVLTSRPDTSENSLALTQSESPLPGTSDATAIASPLPSPLPPSSGGAVDLESIFEEAILYIITESPVPELELLERRIKELHSRIINQQIIITHNLKDAAQTWRAHTRREGLPANLNQLLNEFTDLILGPVQPPVSPEPKNFGGRTEVKETLQANSPIELLLQGAFVPSPDFMYLLSTSREERFDVQFSAAVVKELFEYREARRTLLPVFMRAMKKGFIGNDQTLGMKRLTNLGKQFVEVKIPGAVSQARLVACLDGNVLRIERLIYKSGQDGSMDRFKNICAQ